VSILAKDGRLYHSYGGSAGTFRTKCVEAVQTAVRDFGTMLMGSIRNAHNFFEKTLEKIVIKCYCKLME
jgi:hypothetical protein